MFRIIKRACSGASGVSSNNLAAESRRFRNVAFHSLLSGGEMDFTRSTSARINGEVATILRNVNRLRPWAIMSK